jgi:flagellar basal body-associated protein FliL
MAETSNSAVGAHGANVAEGKKSFSKVKTGALVVLIIVLECVMAYLYLPGGNSAANAEANKEAAAHVSKKSEKETAADQHVQLREVDLGKFSLTAFETSSNTTLLIEFHLFGSVVADHSEKEVKGGAQHEGHGGKAGDVVDDDDTTFSKLFKQNKNRFRDQVIVIIRNAQMSDLTDPGLKLIRSQILAKTNSLLGDPLLKEVLFGDFAAVQQ